ncbi:MAG: rod shape-determining protein MreC [Candidatus Eremiobacteraeota bacterium]|nr:rod shape-determining protein MreC [Candidatus Eremiobacteraeota bacterium]
MALIAIIIGAALLALLQIGAQRAGTASPVSAAAGSVVGVAQTLVSAAIGGVRTGASAIVSIPGLSAQNRALRAREARLVQENARLHELAAAYAAETSVRPIVDLYHGIEARVVGFPPENESRAVTIDRGARAGVARNDGVVAAEGIVGRVIDVRPLSSTVLLANDYASRIPAVVQRRRWWGIARGNLASIVVEYLPQDAVLRTGDVVVTGEGRSFHSGIPIGTVVAIDRGATSLYQSVVLKPAVDLNALDRVVVIPR